MSTGRRTWPRRARARQPPHPQPAPDPLPQSAPQAACGAGGAGEIAMRVSVGEIAAMVGGEVIGDRERIVTGISSLQEAAREGGDLLPRQPALIALPQRHPPPPRVLWGQCQEAVAARGTGPVQIVVANPDFAFARIVSRPSGPRPCRPRPGVHPTAIIGERVRLGRDVRVGAYVVIGDGAADRRRHHHPSPGPPRRRDHPRPGVRALPQRHHPRAHHHRRAGDHPPRGGDRRRRLRLRDAPGRAPQDPAGGHGRDRRRRRDRRQRRPSTARALPHRGPGKWHQD